MKNDIFTALQELKRIEPDAAYTKHSRMLVLSAPRSIASTMAQSPRLSTFLRFSTILGVGVTSILFILGGISYINETYSPLALDGLNQKSLVAEANEINNSIEITLGAIDYLDTSNQVTLKKISEISGTTASSTAMAATLAAPVASSTEMDSYLINGDSAAAAPVVPADEQINTILDTIAQ